MQGGGTPNILKPRKAGVAKEASTPYLQRNLAHLGAFKLI